MSTGGQTGTDFTALPVYLHAADVITCGTVTASGSNTGGAFDVAWIVERLV
jgi:hypothetical protein